jgi:hypothetical protein
VIPIALHEACTSNDDCTRPRTGLRGRVGAALGRSSAASFSGGIAGRGSGPGQAITHVLRRTHVSVSKGWGAGWWARPTAVVLVGDLGRSRSSSTAPMVFSDGRLSVGHASTAVRLFQVFVPNAQKMELGDSLLEMPRAGFWTLPSGEFQEGDG